jgi:hypothetical protein
MKTIVVLISFSLITLSINSCRKSDSPTEPLPFSKGEYTGTFSVTFKDYNKGPLTQSGTISFTFSDSTYAYSANVTYASDTSAFSLLNDQGRYSKIQLSLSMTDISTKIVGPNRRNSLYLDGVFSLQSVGTQFSISQDDTFATWNLELVPK